MFLSLNTDAISSFLRYSMTTDFGHFPELLRLTNCEIFMQTFDEFAITFFYQVEHPLASMEHQWRKAISAQRKRAVMACFRMAPLYNLPRLDYNVVG